MWYTVSTFVLYSGWSLHWCIPVYVAVAFRRHSTVWCNFYVLFPGCHRIVFHFPHLEIIFIITMLLKGFYRPKSFRGNSSCTPQFIIFFMYRILYIKLIKIYVINKLFDIIFVFPCNIVPQFTFSCSKLLVKDANLWSLDPICLFLGSLISR